MSLKDLVAKLYPAFIKNFEKKTSYPCVLFLSASSMKERATVRHAVSETPELAWTTALTALEEVFKTKGTGGKIIFVLRADWVTSSEVTTWADCLDRIKSTRRNWFRQGISFDKDYNLAFTEQELNANLILFDETQEKPNGDFRADRAQDYCRKRFNSDFPELSEGTEIKLFETEGLFIQEGMSEPLAITGKGENAGRRSTPKGDSEFFLKLAKNGGNYLAQQCTKKGRFIYGLYPYDDSVVPSYNSLRHFSTLFAMMDVYSTYGKMGGITLGKAISRGLEYGIKTFIRYKKLDDGTEAAYLEDRKQFKLGANGVVILTLARWSELQRTKKYIPLMRAMARGIFSMQKPNGSFIHVLNSEDYTIRDEFRTPYYDGEAVFSMLRLYAITKDEELLKSSEKAFEYFIATDYWKNYDHWLSYAVNELTIYKPEKKYFEFGLNNCLPYLSFIRNRDTYWPTLLELIMAAYNMLCRMKTIPEMSELLERVDWQFFHEALNIRAERMLNGYFYPETAMFFKNPERIVGSFCIRHHAFRVRIDDVQHYLSGFIAYSKYLQDEDNKKIAIAVENSPMLEKVGNKQFENIAEEMDSELAENADETKSTVTEISAEIKPPVAESFAETKLPESKLPEQNLPLRVGVLRANKNIWKPQHTVCAMFYVAKEFNIELLLFSPSDINFVDKTINAMMLENGAKVQKVVPFPKIVENSILYGEDGRKMALLEKDCYLIRHSLKTTKQKVYDMLLQDGRFKEFLIESHTIDTFEQFLLLFEQYYNDVILKPLRGARGIGVARITLEDGQYIVNAGNEKFFLKNVDEFSKFYEEHFTKRKHIFQPYITSRTHSGNPFDIRVHARRGAGGKFKVSPFPRIGNAAGVVSNIATGGYSMNFTTFLKVEFGNDWKMLYDKLMNFGSVFPEYYQSFFRVPIFDVGVDIGIQKRGDTYDLKIFEVNTYIDGPFFEIEDAITHFEYFRYIDEKLRAGSIK